MHSAAYAAVLTGSSSPSLTWLLDKGIQDIYNVCMNTQTLNISLPRELVKKVDKLAKKEYRNRSELIRQALRRYLEDRYEWENLLSYGKKMGIKSEKQVNDIVYEYRHGRKAI